MPFFGLSNRCCWLLLLMWNGHRRDRVTCNESPWNTVMLASGFWAEAGKHCLLLHPSIFYRFFYQIQRWCLFTSKRIARPAHTLTKFSSSFSAVVFLPMPHIHDFPLCMLLFCNGGSWDKWFLEMDILSAISRLTTGKDYIHRVYALFMTTLI